jgi:hypothetical protein
VKVELLKIADCPNAAAARKLLAETLRDLGRSERVQEIEVSNSTLATAVRFPGSPTIRINDLDIETARHQKGDFGLSCRMYPVDGQLRGFPSREMIRQALQAALARWDEG